MQYVNNSDYYNFGEQQLMMIYNVIAADITLCNFINAILQNVKNTLICS